jgi:hypothetical protein
VKNFLAGRMPYRKQFAEKLDLPLPARVLLLSQFNQLPAGRRNLLLKFGHAGRIGSLRRAGIGTNCLL